MGGVGLVPEELPAAEEGAGGLRLVPVDVAGLVHPQGEVGVGPDPDLEHRVDGRLRRRPEEEPPLQLVVPAHGDPEDLGAEPLDVILLLLESFLGDDDGELHRLVVRLLQPLL